MMKTDAKDDRVERWLGEIEDHLTKELIPFWVSRAPDDQNGGYNTHFDESGRDAGTD